MSRKGIGIGLLAAGTLCMLGGIVSIGWGITKMIDSFRTIATFEAPGAVTFSVSEPGTVTLWHDYQTLHGGTTIEHPSNLPSGFSFELIDPVRGMRPMSSTSNATMSSGSTSRIAVGSFDTPDAGDYEIRIQGPEPRIFSITEGGSMAGLGGFFGGMGFGMVGGFLGFILLIAGVVVLVTGKRQAPPQRA